MNNQNQITIIRAFSKGEGNNGFSTVPFYYQGNNRFEPDFTTALRFHNRQQAQQEIANISSDRILYLEIIEVYPNY